MKVAKWGNSLAVRLPKDAAEALGISEGDDIRFEVTSGGEVKLRRELSMTEWLESLSKYQGRLPADFKFDREEANRRGD